jgi:hypothetical protein
MDIDLRAVEEARAKGLIRIDRDISGLLAFYRQWQRRQALLHDRVRVGETREELAHGSILREGGGS